MDKVQRLAELIYNSDTSAGLFPVWDYIGNDWQKVWLNRAQSLIDRAKDDEELATRIELVLANGKGSWEVAIELKDLVKTLVPLDSGVLNGG